MTLRPFDSAQGRPEFVEGRLARAARALPVAPASVPAILLALWLVGAVVTWNVVFDARIVKGARDYVDRQQLFIDGRGPRQDMEQSMAAARAGGLRAAGLWSGVELAPGIALAGAIRLRSRRRAPAARPAASR